MNAADDADTRELRLTRLLDASPEAVFRCWTEAALLKQWFAPKPWTVARAELDVRPGGSSLVVMRSPEGEEYPNSGVYLEVVPGRKFVFTDAYTSAWRPSAKPYFTGIVTLEPEGEKTRYTALARHWTAEDAQAHEKMGFHEGWNRAADQLEEVAKTL